MTAFVLKNLAPLSASARSLRMVLMRFARTLDTLVSARAAREVPEWRMIEVQNEIHRFQGLSRGSY